MKRRPTAFDRAIGAKLRQYRLARGWTQWQLGEKIDVSFQAIQKYESGENRLTASALQELALLFEVPTAALYPDPDTVPEKAPFFDSAFVLAGQIGRLSSRERRAIGLLVDALTGDATP